MSDHDRTVFAAVEALTGALLAIPSFILIGVGGVGPYVGFPVMFLSCVALAQAIAVGAGLVSPQVRSTLAGQGRTGSADERPVLLRRDPDGVAKQV